MDPVSLASTLGGGFGGGQSGADSGVYGSTAFGNVSKNKVSTFWIGIGLIVLGAAIWLKKSK